MTQIRFVARASFVLAFALLMPGQLDAALPDLEADPMGPKLARGLSTQFGTLAVADIDAVNLLNGNLNLTIPLGQRYPAGGSLSYQLVAYYNSNDSTVRFREDKQQPHGDRLIEVAVPDVLSNAGRGWSVHLGRLFEGVEWREWQDVSRLDRDKLPLLGDFAGSFLYVGPDGSRSYFRNTLHGEAPTPGVFYSRDGSYKRMRLLAPTPGNPACPASAGLTRCAAVEMANGEVHRFEKRTNWPDQGHRLDMWRLAEIHDRPTIGNGGNRITIRYLSSSWEVVDRYGRVQRVFTEDDSWFGRRVARVEVTATAGRTATYSFDYTPAFFDHVDGSPSGTTQTFEVGQLESIELPPHRNIPGSDRPAYRFFYETPTPAHPGNTYLEKVALATGGSIEWDFGRFFMPSVELCEEEQSEGGSSVQNVVRMRTVRNPNGAVLEKTKYLRTLDTSSRVPSNFCNSAGSGAVYEPDAELIVGTLQQIDGARSRLSLNYFSVWPYPRLETFQNGDIGGWGSEDYGRPITRDVSLDNDDRRFLSTRTFECPFTSSAAGGDPELLSASCTPLRSTYLSHVQDRTDCRGGLSWSCRGINRHVQDSVTVYEDDGGRRTTSSMRDSDGFGQFRTEVTDGTISAADWRRTTTGYNRARGELRYDAQGFASLGTSTWTVIPRAKPWILTRFSDSTITYRTSSNTLESEKTFVCYLPDSPMVQRTRRRVTSSIDRPNDIVTVYGYNGSGLPDDIAYYGGDAPQHALPTGAGCLHDVAQTSIPQYRFLRTFDKGVLKTERLAGSTTTLANYRIDANTSAVDRSIDATGLVSETYQYNQLGWVTLVSRSHSGDSIIAYNLPGLNGHPASSEPFISVRTQKRVGSVVTVFDRSRTDFDAMGRVARTFSYHPEAGDLKTVRAYTKDGRLAYETTPHLSGIQATGAMRTSFRYDALGRVTAVTKPDGWTTTRRYSGIRQVIVEQMVGNDEVGGAIDFKTARTTTDQDRYGNALRVAAPRSTTTFEYDARNRIRLSRRGAQVRRFTFDGRGFLTQEAHPEIGLVGNGVTVWSDFDVAGNAGRRTIDNRILLRYEYDDEGRLERVFDSDENLLLKQVYGVSGTGNGRLVASTRFNHLDVQNTAGAIRYLGTDRETIGVRFDQTYHALGSPRTRTTSVTTSGGFPVASFVQSWTYDALGRRETIAYPRCTRAGCAGTDEARTVTLTYGRGAGSTLGRIDTSGPLGVSMTYHDNGQLASYVRANGRVDRFGIGPNFLPRVSSIALSGNASGAPAHLDLGAYRYDGAGNIVQIGADRFLYDLNSRLDTADVPGSPARRTYVYDQHDNLLRKNGNDIEGGGYDIPTSPSTNRLVGTSEFDTDYDAAGNLTLVGHDHAFHYAFHYDDLGKQQAMVVNADGSAEPCAPGGNGTCYLYWYTPDDERLVTSSVGENGTYSWTVRDLDGRVLRTYREANENTRQKKDFVYAGRTLIASRDVDSGDMFHHHADHLGSTRVKTNRFGGLRGTSHFQAYGGDVAANGAGERISDWAGYEEDENGLTHNLRARTYFNTWGRFFSPDPARDGWNLYAYARNNPISKFDPTGLAANEVAPGTQEEENHTPAGEPDERQTNVDESTNPQGDGELSVVEIAYTIQQMQAAADAAMASPYTLLASNSVVEGLEKADVMTFEEELQAWLETPKIYARGSTPSFFRTESTGNGVADFLIQGNLSFLGHDRADSFSDPRMPGLAAAAGRATGTGLRVLRSNSLRKGLEMRGRLGHPSTAQTTTATTPDFAADDGD